MDYNLDRKSNRSNSRTGSENTRSNSRTGSENTRSNSRTGSENTKLNSRTGSEKKGAGQTNKITEKLTADYIKLNPEMWPKIPVGAHIRYIKKNKSGENLSREQRFKSGGYVRNQYNKDGKGGLVIENKPNGNKYNAGYISYPLAFESVEELWKKYDRNSYIELCLINSILTVKQKQIDDHEERISRLEKHTHC